MKKNEQLSSREHGVFLQRRIKKNSSTTTKKRNKKIKRVSFFGYPVIEVPSKLDLFEGSNKACDDFFNELRNILKKDLKCIYLSFKNTSALKAMPMLIIYSIIDTARRDYNIRTKINVIWSKKVSRVNMTIKGSGSFIPSEDRENNMKNTSTLPVIMGDNARANELSNAFVDYILEKYYPEASPEREQQIASAIQETVDNVGRHAYPNIEDHEKKRWWFCCDRLGDHLYIVIYDNGIGIPSSLSENNAVMLARINALYPDEFSHMPDNSFDENSFLDKAKDVLDKAKVIAKVKILKQRLSDGQLIRAAMHTDVTSTELEKHGQGSKSIKGLITDNENSYVLMFSNYGFYRYSDEQRDNESCVDNTEYKIPGTLIQWSI